MSNLLLEKDKKKFFKELVLRLVVVFLFFLLVTIFISLVLLVPSYALTLTKETSISDKIKIFEKTIDFRKQDLPVKILKEENLKIDFLNKSENIYISDFISEIIEEKPKEIKIKSFFYEVGNNNKGYLVVRGEAKNRDILISFIDKLESKEDFTKIDFPVSNLIKGKSLDFSVKIYFKKDEK